MQSESESFNSQFDPLAAAPPVAEWTKELFTSPSNENQLPPSTWQTQPDFETIPYYNSKPYSVPPGYKRENPRQREVIRLLTEGYTNKEAAAEVGYSPVSVSSIKRQDWAQEQMARIQTQAGVAQVAVVLQGAALDAAKTISSIANGAAKDATMLKLKAAQDILNRVLGCAPQLVKHGKIEASELTDAELAKIAVQN